MRLPGLEKIPGFYDFFMDLCEARGLGRWRARLARSARGRLLDVGVGTGRSLRHYGPDATIVGIDPWFPSLLAARKKEPEARLILGQVEDLPFVTDTFDIVASSLTFCSVGDPQRGLREIERVMCPGGELRMLEHVRSRGRFVGATQDLLQPFWTWITGGCHPNRDTEFIVEAAGFRVERWGRRESGTMRGFVARRDLPDEPVTSLPVGLVSGQTQ